MTCGQKSLRPLAYCKEGSRKKRRRSRSRTRSRSKIRSCRCRSSSKGRRSRRSRRRRKSKKCHRSGPRTINPFLNFLRDFRKKHCNWPVTKTAIIGAKVWCEMPMSQKKRYYKAACKQRMLLQKCKKKNRSRARRR